eukprot:6442004-Amphidinium_carterae.1
MQPKSRQEHYKSAEPTWSEKPETPSSHRAETTSSYTSASRSTRARVQTTQLGRSNSILRLEVRGTQPTTTHTKERSIDTRYLAALHNEGKGHCESHTVTESNPAELFHTKSLETTTIGITLQHQGRLHGSSRPTSTLMKTT